MGQLKPDAKYIYERVNGITYAREFGSSERKIVGMDYEAFKFINDMKEEELWHNIREAAKSNAALHQALESCKVLYYLSKEDGNSTKT